MVDLPVIPPTLGQDCYPASAQAFVNEAVGNARVQLDNSGFSVVLNQEATPSATQRSYLWRKPSTGFTYNWDAGIGAWVIPHPIVPGDGARWPWNGTLGAIDTFDGGEVGTVGAAAGPFWEVDTTMAGRVFIAAGTLPSGASLSQGATGGEDKHTQLIAELAAHTHALTNIDNTTNTLAAGTGTGGGIVIPREINAVTGSTGTSTPFNVLNPYIVGYWLKRTARTHRRG